MVVLTRLPHKPRFEFSLPPLWGFLNKARALVRSKSIPAKGPPNEIVLPTRWAPAPVLRRLLFAGRLSAFWLSEGQRWRTLNRFRGPPAIECSQAFQLRHPNHIIRRRTHGQALVFIQCCYPGGKIGIQRIMPGAKGDIPQWIGSRIHSRPISEAGSGSKLGIHPLAGNRDRSGVAPSGARSGPLAVSQPSSTNHARHCCSSWSSFVPQFLSFVILGRLFQQNKVFNQPNH